MKKKLKKNLIIGGGIFLLILLLGFVLIIKVPTINEFVQERINLGGILQYAVTYDCEDSSIARTSGGTVYSQGDNPPNELDDDAFDDNTATKWLDAGGTDGQSWITYHYGGGAEYKIARYSITSANDFPVRDPKDWNLEGSDDNSTWIILDTQSGIEFISRFQTKNFTIANESVGNYNYYRLNITDIWDAPSANSVQLSEIELYECTPQFTIPTINNVVLNSTSGLYYDNESLYGYCNASDEGDDDVVYNAVWYKDGVVTYVETLGVDTSLSAAGDNTCSILVNGTLMCWGWDDPYGQLGDGYPNVNQSTPVFVASSNNFSFISVGAYNICGLLTNGSAMCWGHDSDGQVGDGNGFTYNITIPVFVSGNHNFSTISAPRWQTCGSLTNGSAMCWGRDEFGELGDGDDDEADEASPVFVITPYNFSSVTSHYDHSCGVITNGSAMCWGADDDGQIGDGDDDEANEHVPVFVSGNHNFSSLHAGLFSTCGLLTNGSAMCWGADDDGQIGDGDDGQTDQHVPILVDTSEVFSSIDLGSSAVCGVITNGSAMCWGRDLYGELGDGDDDEADEYSPVFVNSSEIFSVVAESDSHGCGLLTNGRVMCWGWNNAGQLGNGYIGWSGNHSPVYVDSSYRFGKGRPATNGDLLVSTLSSSYTSGGENWTFECNVYDQYNSATTVNTSVLILDTSDTTPPTITNVVLNSTSGNNYTTDNLTVYYTLSNGNTTILDWRNSSTSIAVLNMPFDTNSSTNVKDYTTFGNNGTTSSNPEWVSQEVVGGAYKFDGSNYINLSEPADLDFTSSDNFTVCAWVNMTSLDGSWRTIIGKGNNQWTLQHSTTHLPTFSIYNGASWDVEYYTEALTVGTAYHLCGRKQGTEVSIWVNGSKGGTPETTTGPADSSYEVHIGHNSQTNSYIDAIIDEVLVFNKSLSAEQIQAIYNAGLNSNSMNLLVSNETIIGDNFTVAVTGNNIEGDGATVMSNWLLITEDPTPPTITWEDPTPTDGDTISDNFTYLNTTITDASETSAWFDWNKSLVGYWAMDFYNSTGIYDNSSYDNFGTFSGGLGTGDLITGKRGNALDFDGDADLINLASEIDVDGNATISIWIYAEGLSQSSNMFLGKIDGDNYVAITNGGDLRIQDASSTNRDWTNFGGTTGEWYHVAIKRNESHWEAFKNGVSLGLNTVSGSNGNLLVDSIGQGYTGNEYEWNGLIDEVLIFNRSLTAEEINATYNAGTYRLFNNFTSLLDGTYNYSAYAIDAFGNLNITSPDREITLAGDAINPIASFGTNPVNNSNESSQSVTFELSCSDNVDVDTLILYGNWTGSWHANQTNSSAVNASVWSIQVDNIPEGNNHIWGVWCNDTAGRSDWTDFNRTFSVDTTPPTITWEDPTPTDGDTISDNFTYLNTTITDASDTSAWFDWNKSLIGYWGFDYYNSTGVYDNSSYDNHGTFFGGLGTDNLTTGKRGNALDFDGIDDFINITHDSSFETTDGTVMMWINMNDLDENTVLSKDLSGCTGDCGHFTMGYNLSVFYPPPCTDKFCLRLQNDGNGPHYGLYSNDTMLTMEKDMWYHVAFTFGSQGMYLYINGIEHDYNESVKGIDNNQLDLLIGKEYPGGTDDNFNGSIDEIIFFSRQLSVQEINASYNSSAYRLFANFTSLSDGTYNYSAYAIDEFGNLNITSPDRQVTVSADTTNPIASFGTNPVNNSNESSQSVTFELSCSDNVDVDTLILYGNWTGSWHANQTNSSAVNASVWSIQVDDIPEGNNHIWGVWCNDTAGGIDWTDFNRTFTVDTTLPTITFERPPTPSNTSSTSSSVTIVANISDDLGISSWIDFDSSLMLWLSLEGNALDNSSFNWSTTDGGVTYASGKFGQAATGFTATNKIIVNSSLDYASGNMTISFWMYVVNGATPNRQNPIGKAYGGDGTFTLEPSGYINFFFGSFGGDDENYTQDLSGDFATNGTWEHWAITRDRSSRITQWYKNGVASGAAYNYNSLYDPLHSTNDLEIGDDYVNPLNGSLDEIMIFNRSLSLTEIKALYDSKTNKFNTSSMNLAEGQHNYTVYAIDAAGNANNSGWNYFNVDTTPPTITLPVYTNATQYKNTQSLIFNISVVDASAAYCSINVDGNTNQTLAISSGWCNGTYALTGIADGNKTINAYANDTLGNTALNNSYVVWVDTTTPTPLFGTNPVNTYNDTDGSITFELKCSDNVNPSVLQLWGNWTGSWHANQTNSTPVNDTIWSIQVDNIPDGSRYVWGVYCNDSVGNENWTNTNRTFTVDTTPPSITWEDPTPNDGDTISDNFTYLNTTITDASETSAWFDWNKSLVGYWSMDYYNSTGVHDNSSYSNFGTFNGGQSTSDIVTGKRGNALEFDGVGDYVKTSTSPVPNDDFSVSLWFYPTSFCPNNGAVISQSTDWYVHCWNNELRFCIETSCPIETATAYSLNTWHHYIGVYDYSTEQTYAYFDGSLVGNKTTTTLSKTYDYVWIGKRTLYFNGSIDEVLIFNRALSPEEINATYNAGTYRLMNNFTSLSEGTYNYSAYAIDEFGNLNITSPDREITISAADTTNPIASFGTNPVNNSNESSQSVTFELSCSDNVDVDTLILYGNWTGSWHANQTNSSAVNASVWSIQVDNIPEGNNHIWGVWCNDTAGRIDWTGFNRTFSVDTTPPTITWEDPTPPDGDSVGDNFTYLNATISDASDTSAFFDWNKSLVAYWSMDYYNSTGIYDNSSYGNFATFTGTGFDSDDIASNGTRGNTLYFPGVDQRLDAGEIMPTSTYTKAAWIYRTDAAVLPNILSGDVNSNGHAFWAPDYVDSDWCSNLSGGNWSLRAGHDYDWCAVVGPVVPTNTWVHAAVTYDSAANTMKLYYNGTLVDTNTSVSTFTDTTVQIGAFASGNEWEGYLDEVMLFDRVLSNQEILALYSNSENRLYNNFTSLLEGTYNYSAYAIDAAGNLNITSPDRQVTVDYPSFLSGCGTISSSGYYTLNQNVSSTTTCFPVSAADVTIDCASYKITYSTGGGGSTRGVYSNQLNTTVKNCNIVDGTPGGGNSGRQGIYYSSANYGTIDNNTITCTTSGAIALYGADFNTIVNNDVTCTNSAGISLKTSSDNNTIENNTARGEGSAWDAAGIILNDNSQNNTLTNNTATSENQPGIWLDGNADFTTVIGNNATGDGGIYIDASDNNTLINNIATSPSPGGHGIYLYSDSAYNTLINNTISSDDNNGIRIWSSKNNDFINNTVTTYSAVEDGIEINRATNCDYNTFTGMTVTATSGKALQFVNCRYITVSNSTFTSNASIVVALGNNDDITFINNTFISGDGDGTLLDIDSNVENGLFYWNNFTETTGYYVDNDDASNDFNTTIGGKGQGNYYFNITSLDITDSDSDGWGDGGSDYPVNDPNWPARWNNLGADWGPYVGLIGTCTYSSGNWNVDCSDNCTISSEVDLSGNNVSIIGTGTFTTTVDIFNYEILIIEGTDSSNKCIVTCDGGCFKN